MSAMPYAPSPSAVPNPNIWTEHSTPQGIKYYHNRATARSVYTLPPGATLAATVAPALQTGLPAPSPGPPVPVASEKIVGTSWRRIRCADGRQYFHDPTSGATTWTVPPEVARLGKSAELDPARAILLERSAAAGAVLAPQYRGVLQGMGAAGGGAREEELADEDVTFDPEELGLGQSEPPPALQQPSVPALARPPAPPKEAFFELLEERGVNAFSRYEKVLADIAGDARYKSVRPADRRPLFEEYCAGAGKMATSSAAPKKTLAAQIRAAEAALEHWKQSLGDESGESASPASGLSLFEHVPSFFPAAPADLELALRADAAWQEAAPHVRRAAFRNRAPGLRSAVQSALDRVARQAVHEDGEGSFLLDLPWQQAWRRLQESPRACKAGEERCRAAWCEERTKKARLRARARQAEAARSQAAGRVSRSATADERRAFEVLLGELVRSSLEPWEEAWLRLQADPLGRADALDEGEARRLFEEHCRGQEARARKRFDEVLEERMLRVGAEGVEATLEALREDAAVAAVSEEWRREWWEEWQRGRGGERGAKRAREA